MKNSEICIGIPTCNNGRSTLGKTLESLECLKFETF